MRARSHEPRFARPTPHRRSIGENSPKNFFWPNCSGWPETPLNFLIQKGHKPKKLFAYNYGHLAHNRSSSRKKTAAGETTMVQPFKPTIADTEEAAFYPSLQIPAVALSPHPSPAFTATPKKEKG
jgi:hypothetical protein